MQSETCDYVSSSSSEGKVRKGAYLVMRTLLQDKVYSLYEFPVSAQRRLDETMDDYCATCIETCGVDGAVSDKNIDTFMDAIEQVFGNDMHTRRTIASSNSVHTSDSPVTVSTKKDARQTIGSSASMSSVHTSDSPVTVSTKKVIRWKKDTEAACRCSSPKQCQEDRESESETPTDLPPGVLWKKTKIKPSDVKKKGLTVIQEHIMEDHIKAFETALDEHEVELVNEIRSMQGKTPILNNSAVVVNNCVYVTGGPAVFACTMETYNSEKRVNIFIHVNKTTSKYCNDKRMHKTFVVECAHTGACILRHSVSFMRFWKELGTATICMLPADDKTRHMAPTTYFHLESVSHCRLFAKELTRKH